MCWERIGIRASLCCVRHQRWVQRSNHQQYREASAKVYFKGGAPLFLRLGLVCLSQGFAVPLSVH